jgi:hypothetical protein
VAGSEEPSHRNRNTVTTNVSCFISSASFIPSAWYDEVLQALSLLVLVGVFWLLGQGRKNKGKKTGYGLNISQKEVDEPNPASTECQPPDDQEGERRKSSRNSLGVKTVTPRRERFG